MSGRACATLGEAVSLLVEDTAAQPADRKLAALLALVMSPVIAATPLPPADPAEASCDDLRAAVLLAIRAGQPTLPWVARRLGVSARTLQRRLQDQQTSFRAIVDEVRCAEAARLLERGERLVAIAEQLGFSDERAFRRAFRRWTGATPRRVRSRPLARPVLVRREAGA